MGRRFDFAVGAVLVLAALAAPAGAQDFKDQCAASAKGLPGTGRITEALYLSAGLVQMAPPAPRGANAPSPDHCLARGKSNERTGIDGKPYVIGCELRLPVTWNGKFFFQGGGGVDGVLRPRLNASGRARHSALTSSV